VHWTAPTCSTHEVIGSPLPGRRKSDEKDQEDALREGCQLIFATFLLDPTGLNPNVKHERQRVVIRSFVVTTFLTGPLDFS
jgi:hypothetical protein